MMQAILLLVAVVVGEVASQSCVRDYTKIGCFKEGHTKMDLIVNDRDATHKSYSGIMLDWRNFRKAIHSLACRCSAKAKANGYVYFSIRFWAECWAGKDESQLNALIKDKSKRSDSCVNHDFKACVRAQANECVGKAFNEYVYSINKNSYSNRPSVRRCNKIDFRKVGCFKRNSGLLTHLIITDLDPTHQLWGTAINWEDYQASIRSLACRCREKASLRNFAFFSIGFYGDCWAGTDKVALEKKLRNPGVHASTSCVGGDFQTCNHKSVNECAGTEDNEYVYEIL